MNKTNIKDIKKKERVIVKRLPIYYCDGCGNQISVITNSKSYFRKSAFQCGLNSKKEIGTWCSEKCFNERLIKKGK